MNEDKIKIAVEEFRKDSYWGDIYDNAPSDLCKRHEALTFYYSWFGGFYAPAMSEEELNECHAELWDNEMHLSAMDWDYLYRHTGCNPYKVVTRDRRDLCEGKELHLGSWEFMYKNTYYKNPFHEICRRKIDEMKEKGLETLGYMPGETE